MLSFVAVAPFRSFRAAPSTCRRQPLVRHVTRACSDLAPGHPGRVSSVPSQTLETHDEDDASSAALDDTESFIGGGAVGSGGGGGGGGWSDDGDELPRDVTDALACGALTAEGLSRYRALLKSPFLRPLMSIPAFRTRMLADSAFFFKLMVQELIGNGTCLASEIVVRGKDIVHELEYVASDLLVGTVVEAGFVWLLAPTLPVPRKLSASKISQYLASLPANAFQASSALQSFTVSQRVASFMYAGMQYAAIGVIAGVVGTAITYGLVEARKATDKSYRPERPLPALLPSSLGWGAFMAISSNTRFQLVEGMERVIGTFFAGKANGAVNTGIVALRFANNYYGGVQFIQFFRFLGLHATGEEGH